jgi:hypothetical protein
MPTFKVSTRHTVHNRNKVVQVHGRLELQTFIITVFISSLCVPAQFWRYGQLFHCIYLTMFSICSHIARV